MAVPTAARLQVALARTPLSPKRRSDGSTPDGWYPYYAGFSSEFAASLLEQLHPTGRIVLDPWNGSGTTTLAAYQLGANAIGFDLNPVANLIARSKLVSRKSLLGIEKMLPKILAAARKHDRPASAGDPLVGWLSRDAAGTLRSLDVAIRSLGGKAPLRSPLVCFLLVCLLRAARPLAARTGSNPTWLRPLRRRTASSSSLRSSFCSMVHQLIQQTEASPSRLGFPRIAIADSRSLPLEDESIDIVLTSPPYCTRIDYAVSSRFELEALGFLSRERDFRKLRCQLMGTTTVEPGSPGIPSRALPQEVRALLVVIRSHSSYSSGMYYFKNLHRYFQDALSSVKELARVLKPGGHAYFVLQNSYYKEIPIDLPKLFVAMARAEGLRSNVAFSMPVPRVMTSLNPLAKRHLRKRSYVECIVVAEKPE